MGTEGDDTAELVRPREKFKFRMASGFIAKSLSLTTRATS